MELCTSMAHITDLPSKTATGIIPVFIVFIVFIFCKSHVDLVCTGYLDKLVITWKKQHYFLNYLWELHLQTSQNSYPSEKFLEHTMSLSRTTHLAINESVYPEGNTKKGLLNFRTNLASEEY